MKLPTSLELCALLRSFGVALGVAFLSQCSAPISVRTVQPESPAGVDTEASDLDGWLSSAQAAHHRIRKGDLSAIGSYNYSVARLVEEIEKSGLNPWSRTITTGSFRLCGTHPVGSKPLEHRLMAADTLLFRGDAATVQSKVDGIGAPVVEAGNLARLGHEQLRDNQPLRNLTALVRFDGNMARLELIDPYQVEQVNFGGRTQRLSANYGAACMFGMAQGRIDKLGFSRMLNPSVFNYTANLNFLQPYDPKRIPVLFVHGLDSTPATFAPMYFKLIEDPVIRKNYQFWVFSYPSGYPYPYSASLLRRELDEVERDYPRHKGIVIVGHSMGGLISRLMVTDVGDRLWMRAFGRSPAETRNLTKDSRKALMDSLVFSDRKGIDRALFYAAPHRGSILASNWIGRTISRMVRTPALIADIRNAVFSAATADIAGLTMQSAPNSIGTLSPINPFVVEINKIPIAERVPYHSIMGDRGRGDTPDSSDGVVEYWSSKLTNEQSVKIVPSGHSAHEHPEGIEEAHRILKLHLARP